MNYYTDEYGRIVQNPDPSKNKYKCTCKDGKIPAHLPNTPIDDVIWITCQMCGGTGRTNVNYAALPPGFSGYLTED